MNDKEKLHLVTEKLIDEAFYALKEKMLKAQVKYGLTEGCLALPPGEAEDGKRFFTTAQGCVDALYTHLKKGDVLDSIAYLVMLNHLEGGDKVKLLADSFKSPNGTGV